MLFHLSLFLDPLQFAYQPHTEVDNAGICCISYILEIGSQSWKLHYTRLLCSSTTSKKTKQYKF